MIRVFALLLVLFSCENVQTQTLEPLKIGIWGGDQFKVDVTANQVTFTWGCSAGSIELSNIKVSSEPIVLKGTYRFIGGAQIADPDLRPKPQTVNYTLSLVGHTLTVKAAFEDGSEIGSFSAVYGAEAKLYFCA